MGRKIPPKDLPGEVEEEAEGEEEVLQFRDI